MRATLIGFTFKHVFPPAAMQFFSCPYDDPFRLCARMLIDPAVGSLQAAYFTRAGLDSMYDKHL
jgi:hypothetical protein